MRAGWLAGWSVAGRLVGWEAGRLGGGRREAEAGGQEEADSTVVWLWTGPGKQIDVLATWAPSLR